MVAKITRALLSQERLKARLLKKRKVRARSTPEGARPTPKRLVVCCDGTLNDGVNTKKPITNVARIARCIKNDGDVNDSGRPIPQIVFYLRGIGTGTSFLTNAVDGVYGRGVSSTIRESYAFLCLNWNPDDEIILIGFSRGAFAVRVVAELIEDVGLLRKDALHLLNKIYDSWQKSRAADKRKEDKSRSITTATRREYETKLRTDVKVKACAVWDTVQALLGDKLAFIDESIPLCVASAFQALALNEERGQFEPLLWKDSGAQKLRQCWFLGSHSDVGGGNEEQALANISLLWMISQLSYTLEFDADAIRSLTRGPVLDEVARQRDLNDSGQKITKVHMDKGSLTLELDLPVGIFQKRTGVQVGWFAALQRIAGWSYREPFASDGDTQERIHWTVAIFLSKQIVSGCRPLYSAMQKAKDRSQGDLYETRTEPCCKQEREMLASWIAYDCLQLARINKEGRAAKPHGARPLELSSEVLPIYLVLWQPGDWEVTSNAEHRHSVSVQVDGRIHVHYQSQTGGPTGSPAERIEEVKNLTMAHMNVRGGMWRSRKTRILTGSLRVHLDEGLNIT